MLNDTTPGTRPDTVIISADEYSDLVRAAAQLDMLVTLMVNTNTAPACLIRAMANERGIRKEENNGNRQTVLLDEAQGELHDQRHD